MKEGKRIEPLISDLPKTWSPAQFLSWDQARKELAAIERQFKIIHDLPKIGEIKPGEYLHDALVGLRVRTVALHEQCNLILAKKAKSSLRNAISKL